MVNWREFLDYVLPDLPKCPRSVAVIAIRDSAIQFCKRTGLWWRQSDMTDIVAGQATYAFQVPTGSSFSGVLHMEYSAPGQTSATSLTPATYDELSQRSNWRELEGETPREFYGREPGLVTLIPRPTVNQENAIRAEVMLKPSRNSQEGPEFLLENWGDAIGHGAKARLLAMRNRSWSGNPLYNQQLFDKAVANAKRQVYQSSTRKPLKVRGPRFV